MSAFPKHLFVKYEDGGTGPDYLNACRSEIETAELGQKVRVGVYVLRETIEVKGVCITNPVGARRRKPKAA